MIEQFEGEAGADRLVECLRQLPLTAGNRVIAAALAARCSLVQFEPGQLILRQGGSDDDLYFVISGSVSIQQQGRHLAVRNSVTHIGELAILDPNSPRKSSARAIDVVVCAKLSEPDFSAVARHHPEMWRALAVQALDRLSQHSTLAVTQDSEGLVSQSDSGRLIAPAAATPSPPASASAAARSASAAAKPAARALGGGPEGHRVLDFWRDAGPSRWFKKDAAFDADFGRRFAALHEQAVSGALDDWADDADGALALLILLDQYPRNVFRDSPRMYASDPQARRIASSAVDAGFDQQVESSMQAFFYLPFMHSEDLADQDRAVSLCATLDDGTLWYATMHRDIIARFGRFPHRNGLLGRVSTAQELAFLQVGGFSG